MVAIDNRERRNNFNKNRGANPTGKLRLRAWLQQETNRGTIPGLKWIDEAKTELLIPWLHGSKQNWSINDVMLFQRWAQHTGRYSIDDICPKRWKANFRCALKSLSDVVELQCCGQTRGKDAFRVYKFLDPSQAARRPCTAAKTCRVENHQCRNRRRTTSGSVTMSCPSPLAPSSESSTVGSDEEEPMEDDNTSSDDASIEDVFDVAAFEITDAKQVTFQLVPTEDMCDVNLLLSEIHESNKSLNELFFGPADHSYSAADLSEFNGNAPDDCSDLVQLEQFNFNLASADKGVLLDKKPTYNLPDIESLLRGLV